MADDSIENLPRSLKEARELGEKWYFTGKPCNRGHVSRRLVSSRACRQCALEFNRSWRAENVEVARSASRRWNAENREQMREACRAYHANNLERERARCRSYHANNRQKRREDGLTWRRANPDVCLSHGRNRRARKRAAEGTHIPADIDRIRKAQKDRCAYCRTNLRGKGHVDHIVALTKRGSNWPRNIQILCQPCNNSKYNHDPIEFAQSLGLLV
jgi:5-methylcytosine-specific restriction endonuclease McrA